MFWLTCYNVVPILKPCKHKPGFEITLAPTVAINVMVTYKGHLVNLNYKYQGKNILIFFTYTGKHCC